MVDAYVGPNSVHFRVHGKLLGQASLVFDRMFNGNFQEAINKSVHLPEDDPEAFDSFLRWAYGSVLDEPNMEESKQDSGPLWDRIKLLCFAEKYCIEALIDRAMDTIVDAYKGAYTHPSAEGVLLAYSNTSKGAGIRLYMARSCEYRFVTEGASAYSEASLDILANISDLSRDVFSLLMSRGHHLQESPDDAPRCDYHRHGKNQACTQRGLPSEG